MLRKYFLWCNSLTDITFSDSVLFCLTLKNHRQRSANDLDKICYLIDLENIINTIKPLPITDKGQLGDLGVVSFHLPTEESVGHSVKQSKTTTNGCQQIFLKQK